METLAAPLSGNAPSDKYRVPSFANGAVIAGKYLVEETLAEGGIGVVVVAKHLALQQRVAIKYLKPKALSNPVVVERFVREARLAAQITSEHVVRVHDVGTLPEAGPYMVMEYLVGEDLGKTVQSGPLPMARAVDYVLQACDALAEAHALRIVHRDIKPENMFLAQRASATPILKIIDFGISKVAPRRGEGASWGTETAASERFGTPLYMSPEQLRSTSNVDARTDIWSLGIVLHELLTGSLPFMGEGLPQICTSVLTAPPVRLTRMRPDAPPQLESIILKCLEKEPSLRFRNVAELAQELVPFGPPTAASRVERIFEIVRRGGDSIRPPTPAPGTLQIADITASTNGRMATTDARTATTVNVRPLPGTSRITALASVAGVVCAGLIVGVAVRASPAVSRIARDRSASAATINGSPAPPSLGSTPAQPLAADLSASAATGGLPAAGAPAGASAPPAAAAGNPPETATPATTPQGGRSKGSSPKPRAANAPSPKPAAAATVPSTSPTSRRAQFGERE